MNPIVRNYLFRHPRGISIRLSESRVQPPLNIGLDFLRSVSSGSRVTSLGEGNLGSQLKKNKNRRVNINRKEMGRERMATDGGGKDGKDIKQYLSHIERTATEPRDESLHNFILTQVTSINSTTRLFYLSPLHPASDSSPKHLNWKPGQWIDLFLPGIQRPGGFSIVNIPPYQSSPSIDDLKEEKGTGIELAIQKPILKLNSGGKISEQVAWLFQPSSEILGKEVAVRIGGSFTWPPSFWHEEGSKGHWKERVDNGNRVVFIAGGMGINPLMSMISYIHAELGENKKRGEGKKVEGKEVDDETKRNAEEKRCENLEVKFLYSTKVPASIPAEGDRRGGETEEAILFLDRLQEIFKKREQWDLQLFATGSSQDTIKLSKTTPNSNMETHHQRISNNDIDLILGTMEEKSRTIIYICGPPTMTDSMVSYIRNLPGIDPSRVLCEKWW
ncbi:putative oxidoreductase nad-binding domain-containing protein 1 protein [Botrytis fragariae]|uniref:Putative oxidoreductase nad-binding domain-containing protein 1 protein n=1 Tax=Botrytis fragariae TaxID=1964551 RepID=A0A8H6EMK9_9HELO|nr:putative oxidoreductase nad-binding domain-containing protein 1 protein [Botrytis fragariae]KAF5877787.1 putative oxidoreductase nad-binding domain-containing protein 1 protein [Botrytis fragariae]